MKNNDKNTEKRIHSKRTAEQRAATRRVTSRIFVGVSIALALIFIVFIFVTTNFMGSSNLVTQTVQRTTVSDTISTTGFVIRSEEYVDNVKSGVLVYQVSNGEKVAVDGVIATVFANETDAVNFQKIKDIESEISELEELNNILGSANVGLDTVNNRLDQKLLAFVQTVNKSDFSNISYVQDELISAIYRKQIITGDQDNFDDRIAQLEDEKESLLNSSNSSTGDIIAEKSGYFVSSVDGYESLFSVDSLTDIYYSDIKNPDSDDIKEDKYIGKIISDVNWYLACPITSEQAVAITHNSTSVNVRIPYATNESIPAKIVCVNTLSDEDMAVVVLECNYMNPALAQIRNEAVDILLSSYSGLKVTKEALHDDYVTKTVTDENGNKTTKESKVQGVYVKFGNQVVFKQVYIIHSTEDYVICSENPGDDVLFNGTTLKLYDEVIIEGDDLYDGKLID